MARDSIERAFSPGETKANGYGAPSKSSSAEKRKGKGSAGKRKGVQPKSYGPPRRGGFRS